MPFQLQLALRIIYLDPNPSSKIKEQLASTIIDNYLSTEWAAQSLILLQPLPQSILGRLDGRMEDRDSRIRMSAASPVASRSGRMDASIATSSIASATARP